MKELRKCKDCDKLRKLMYHHDPPKSKIFKEETFDAFTFIWEFKKYFIDKDGIKKLVSEHLKNRRLCNTCHRKADIAWGIHRAGWKYHKPKKNKKKNKYRLGHIGQV